jgi:hypothetical protein
VIAAGGSTAVHDPQRLVQVLSDIAAIDIGRPADRGSALSASASRARDKDPPLTSRYHVRLIPPRIGGNAGFDSGRGDCGGLNGTACLRPRSLSIYFGNQQRLSICWYFCWHRSQLMLKLALVTDGYGIKRLPARGTRLYWP